MKCHNGLRTWLENFNFSVVLYGRETLPLTFIQGHGLKVSENKVITRERAYTLEERINRIMENITEEGT
jgi:hypothetical protein